MKKFLCLMVLATAALFFDPVVMDAQTLIQQSQLFAATTVATVQPTVPEGSFYPNHTISIVTTGTAVGTAQLQTCTTTLISSCSNMSGSSAVSVATCTVANPCMQTIEGLVQAFGAFTITIGTCTGCTVSITYTAVASPIAGIGNLTDGVYQVPPQNCWPFLTTGTLAANGAGNGGGVLVAPAMERQGAALGFPQLTTTAATNTTTVDCVINPPSRSTAGKGISVTGVTVYFGIQTTALTSITAPIVDTVTFQAAGVGATTVASAATGTLIFSPVSPFTADLVTTAAGTCSALSITFTTPVILNTANQQLIVEYALAQSAASSEIIQSCGATAFFQNNPL